MRYTRVNIVTGDAGEA